MEFNNIILEMQSGEVRNIENKWKTEIILNKNFYERKLQNYNVIEKNESSLKIIRFDIYNTGTIFEFEAEFNPYITDNMSDDIIKFKQSEFFKWNMDNTNKKIENVYIENTNHQIFFVTQSNIDDEEISYSYDGSFHYKTTLDLTQYDMTDTLTLYFTIHTIDEDKDVVIKLKKSDE